VDDALEKGLAYLATQCPVEVTLSPTSTVTYYCQRRVGHVGPHLIGVAGPARHIDRVVTAAVAYCDQLSTFNALTHPEVHRRRLELADAVWNYHRERSEPSVSDAPDQGRGETNGGGA